MCNFIVGANYANCPQALMLLCQVCFFFHRSVRYRFDLYMQHFKLPTLHKIGRDIIYIKIRFECQIDFYSQLPLNDIPVQIKFVQLLYNFHFYSGPNPDNLLNIKVQNYNEKLSNITHFSFKININYVFKVAIKLF